MAALGRPQVPRLIAHSEHIANVQRADPTVRTAVEAIVQEASACPDIVAASSANPDDWRHGDSRPFPQSINNVAGASSNCLTRWI